jgi:hypothetical protein
MAGRFKANAASGCSSTTNTGPLRAALQQLQAGAPLLQQPYSEAAAEQMYSNLSLSYPHIRTVGDSKQPLQGKDRALLSEVLDLVNSYLLWLLAAYQVDGPGGTQHTNTNKGSNIMSCSSASGDGSKRQQYSVDTLVAPLHYANTYQCLRNIFKVLCSAGNCAVHDHGRTPPAVYASLLAEGTGELQTIKARAMQGDGVALHCMAKVHNMLR